MGQFLTGILAHFSTGVRKRLWRSLKYETVYLSDLEDGFEAQRVIGEWVEFYNETRPHSALARPRKRTGMGWRNNSRR